MYVQIQINLHLGLLVVTKADTPLSTSVGGQAEKKIMCLKQPLYIIEYRLIREIQFMLLISDWSKKLNPLTEHFRSITNKQLFDNITMVQNYYNLNAV